MDQSVIIRCSRYLLVLSLALSCGVSCRKRREAGADTPAVIVPDALRENRTVDQAGPVYQSQSKSSIHWQPWSKKTMELAREAERLVLVVVAMPQQAGFAEVLATIERDPGAVRAIHDHYVPVIVDGETVREMGLLSETLCSEIKQPLEMPLFIWMTPDANPVAWIPVPLRGDGESLRIFNQSNEMVSRMWSEDAAYVLRNSALDNSSRRERMRKAFSEVKAAADPAAESLNAARQLASLYDPVSRSIDETGGLFPSGPLDLAAAAALIPGVPENIRERSGATTRELLKDLLPSAMFDPLEGGVFSGRAGPSWSLPAFGWNCPDQARISTVLFRAHLLTGEPAARERAEGLLAFAEKKFMNSDGLFAFGAVPRLSTKDWMWTVADIGKALPPEDAKWWIAATGMKDLGNLPSEIDSRRAFFRSNTLSLHQPLEKTASDLAVPPEDFIARFNRSKAKLLEIRLARRKAEAADLTPNAAANFRMVSAYAAAFTATGEVAYRDKAVALLGRARAAFHSGDVLKATTGKGGPEMTDARAFVYALAVQASQDVAAITLDQSPLTWAAELAAIAEGLFPQDGRLREVSAKAAILDLPIVDGRRVFEDTSGGLFALAAARAAGPPDGFASSLKALEMPMPAIAAQVPVLHTDSILAALVKHHSRVILCGSGMDASLKDAVSRLPLRLFPRATAKDSDGIPPGSVRVISPDGSGKLIANADDLLKELLLPKRKP